MSIFYFVWAAFYVLAALFVVARVGKPRGTITPGVAVYALVINAISVFLLVTAGRNV